MSSKKACLEVNLGIKSREHGGREGKGREGGRGEGKGEGRREKGEGRREEGGRGKGEGGRGKGGKGGRGEGIGIYKKSSDFFVNQNTIVEFEE